MVRNVVRRLERLETQAAAATPGTIQIRILLVHPEEGLTGVLVFETDKPTTKEPGTPEEKERVRAELEQRRGTRLPRKGDPTDTNDCAPA